MRNDPLLVLACALPLLCSTCSGARDAAGDQRANAATSHGRASERGGTASIALGDAAIKPPPSAASDASARVVQASADAASADARTPPADASDASAPTRVDAAAAGGCSSHLCTTADGVFLHVEGDEPWMIGALDWTATVGDRSLGWSSGVSSDNRNLFYALSRRDVDALEAGATVLVDYAAPGSADTSPRARMCQFEPRTPPPSCPATPQPLLHVSMRGCRDPRAAGCAACQVPGTASSFRSSEGADWYNVSTSTAPASCKNSCPTCATCTDQDAREARALPERPECDPCPDDPSTDACFEPKSCDCWCQNRQVLAAACPTLTP